MEERAELKLFKIPDYTRQTQKYCFTLDKTFVMPIEILKVK